MRIILVRLSALGDIVHTWPLAKAIREQRPTAHLTWAVESALAPLVDGHPAVDAVITTATRRWRKRPFSATTRTEIAALKGRFAELAPDLVIDAQGTLKSALVTRLTRAPRRVGLARPWRRELIAGAAYTGTVPGSTTERHVVATNLALLQALDCEPPAPAPAPDGAWLLADENDVPQGPWGSRYGVLLPGAGRADKILPAATLAEVAADLVRRGLEAVVAWGPSEQQRASEVVVRAGSGVHLAPPTGLRELACLLGGATMVVGGDTGPVHLAASLGVPTVGVHLTTDPLRNGPVGRRTAVVSGAAVGRLARGSATTAKRRDVSPSEIIDALERLLGSQH